MINNTKILDCTLRDSGYYTKIKETCVYPPCPIRMGTTIPHTIEPVSKELEAITFTDASKDSPLALAIQTAFGLGVSSILLAGFDGYDTTIDQTQFMLAQENQNIINDLIKLKNVSAITITQQNIRILV
jgi:4-hydroxy 2-oxovalerate aldolase